MGRSLFTRVYVHDSHPCFVVRQVREGQNTQSLNEPWSWKVVMIRRICFSSSSEIEQQFTKLCMFGREIWMILSDGEAGLEKKIAWRAGNS
jgi:hypothetical protein